MSAKELTTFVPESVVSEYVFNEVAKELSLEVDEISPALNLSYQFSAKKGTGKTYLSIECKNNDLNLIQEILKWERPSDAYKNMLAECKSSITIYYRDQREAKAAILKIGAALEKAHALNCITENGQGCLLKLEDLLNCLQKEPQWSWEKEEFPELSGVAISEWR